MQNQIDVLFVRPNDKKNIYGQLHSSLSAIEPPLWAALLAAYVRELDYAAGIYDAEAEDASPLDAANAIGRQNPLLVCIVATGSNLSASTWKMYGARLLIRALKVKSPEIKVILWGLHPSSLPERTMREEEADFVCLGEGFATIAGLLEHIKSGKAENEINVPGLYYRNNDIIVFHPRAPLVKNLDELPMAAWDLLPMVKYRAHNWHCFDDLRRRQPYAVIYTSLGCPFDCSFCALKSLFGSRRVRFRSPEKVIEEIDFLVTAHHIRNIKILDECFVLKRSHVLGICDKLIERAYDLNIWAYARIDTVDQELLYRMKKAGFNWLAYGIESGNDKILAGVSKGGYTCEKTKAVVEMTRAAGINVVGNFMLGLSDDNLETMQDTLELAKELNCEYTNFYTTMAYPGSQLYYEAVKNGVRLPDNWLGYSQYSEDTLPLPTQYLSSEEVLRFRDYAFKEFHANPKYLQMIEQKFGQPVVKHFKEEVLAKDLKRKHG